MAEDLEARLITSVGRSTGLGNVGSMVVHPLVMEGEGETGDEIKIEGHTTVGESTGDVDRVEEGHG